MELNTASVIHSDGKVPALVTEEVAATLYYIARKHPAAGLWPEGDVAAEAEVISMDVLCRLHDARLAGQGTTTRCRAFAVAEPKLADRQWAIGRFSIADIHLFRVYWRFRPAIHAPIGTYPALEAHHDRMLARPAVQKTTSGSDQKAALHGEASSRN